MAKEATTQIKLRLPCDMHAKLVEQAKRNECSLNHELLVRLDWSMNAGTIYGVVRQAVREGLEVRHGEQQAQI